MIPAAAPTLRGHLSESPFAQNIARWAWEDFAKQPSLGALNKTVLVAPGSARQKFNQRQTLRICWNGVYIMWKRNLTKKCLPFGSESSTGRCQKADTVVLAFAHATVEGVAAKAVRLMQNRL